MTQLKNIKLRLAPSSRGQFKAIGGSKADEWNKRLNELTVSALPIANSKDTETLTATALAVAYCTMDIAPADPTEGMLISQLMAANEAALTLYRMGWRNVSENFGASTKLLQLADKAARTVVLLTERLDHHRGRGQQQIIVKHVTTNNVTTDQAIIAESVTNSAGTALLAASSETPMPILDQLKRPDRAGVGRGRETK
jgi:hypothetical protein